MRSILFGMTVYGDYIDTFLNYCLPSLMSPGNLPALARERSILFEIHTDKDGFERLSDKIKYYVNFKLDVIEEDKYLQLGKHQNKDLKLAKKIGADYHCLMPDFVYSENYFSGVLKAIERGHKAIIRLVVSTVAEDILPELNRPRSAIDLATLAFQHRHPGIRNWFITPLGYPRTHVIAYVAEHVIRMCSPHCSPVYIANEVINPVDDILPLDCILDQIIIGDIYCTKPDDGIVMIEISPRDSRKPQNECASLQEFCRIFKWDTKDSLRQIYIFEQETVDSINRDVLDKNYWDDIEIANMKQVVHNALNIGV